MKMWSELLLSKTALMAFIVLKTLCTTREHAETARDERAQRSDVGILGYM